MRVKALLVLFCSIFFVGCSGPKDYDIAKLTEDQKKELGQKLTSDEYCGPLSQDSNVSSLRWLPVSCS